ncbi:MAG: FlgD immunoglobulin-like domain containing protein, partial [Spirochaetaceae bacterium]|nr:FlgD immunoglobulin-like domain containing protein [Spirochaetaceae bacterium]
QTQPSGGTGVGVVTTFDGSDFLQEEDIILQAHRYTGELFTPDLYWENENSIPNSYKNSGLWLPAIDEVANSGATPFSGLVPRPWVSGPSSGAMTFVAGDLFDNANPAPPPLTIWNPGGKIIDGADLDFFFLIAPNHYAARCEDDTASDWYRRIRPWSIKIRNVVTQAGGISILNNIINPNRNERTSLHYTLKNGGTVTIQVFDLAGGLVEILQRGYQDAGEYAVAWDGRNRSGNVVARGIYFIRYVGPGGIDQIRKVLVVK